MFFFPTSSNVDYLFFCSEIFDFLFPYMYSSSFSFFPIGKKEKAGIKEKMKNRSCLNQIHTNDSCNWKERRKDKRKYLSQCPTTT